MPKAKIKTKYPEVQDIKHDLESLKGNTVELAKHVKEDSVGQIESTKQTLKAQTQAEIKKAEKYVKANPMQSVAIAFAGGLIASMILRR